MRGRAEAQIAQMLAKHAAHEAGTHIGSHRLRAGNPIVTRSALHRFEALIDHDRDRQRMSDRHFGAILAMRIPNPSRRARNAGEVSAEEVHCRLYRVGVTAWIVVAFSPYGRGLVALEKRIDVERQSQRRCERRLRHGVAVLGRVLSCFSQIAERGAQKEFAALRTARDAIFVDEGRRLLDAFQFLNRIAAAAEWSLGEVYPIAGILRTRRPNPPAKSLGTKAVARTLVPQRHIRRHLEIGCDDSQAEAVSDERI